MKVMASVILGVVVGVVAVLVLVQERATVRSDPAFTVSLEHDAIFRSEEYGSTLSWNLHDQIVYISHSGRSLQTCKSSEFLLCFISPFPMIMPGKTIQMASYTELNEEFEYSVSSSPGTSFNENVCENESIDLRIYDTSYDRHSWYRFHREQGLLFIKTFEEGSSPEVIPVDEYHLVEGKIFALEDLCD